jgi:uncharacterized protein (TIGR02231 family)
MSTNAIQAAMVLSLLFLPTLAEANDLKAASKISRVTIYPGAAVVTRETQIDVPAGDHTVLLENIVPEINENTLTVKGRSTGAVKIFGASIQTEYLTQASDERVKSLQNKIEALDDEISSQNGKVKSLEKQRAFLDSVQLHSAQQVPKDLITKIPSVPELEQLGSFVGKSFAELESQSEGLRLKLRQLHRDKEALVQKLQELNSAYSKVKRAIAVAVQADSGVKLTLEVSYLVGAVNWQPVYDARVAFEEKKVDLALFGLISQTTGEDWQDALLTISTARPSIGGHMPQLDSWWLRPFQPQAYRAPMAGMMMKSAMEDSSAQLAMDAPAENGMVAERKAEMAYAQTEMQGVRAVFKITRPVNVKSDGTQQRVPITAMTLPAHFEYASTPALVPYAFLKSEVENNQTATLLPGRVNVFLNGDYVGSSSIVKAIGQKEKFDLYLGADEGVTVSRELIEEKSDDTLFAGIPSPNKVMRYTYKVSVENYKALPIKLNLFDHLPVSQDDKIKVKDVKFSLAPTQKDYKDRKGVMLWALGLPAQQKQEITYSFAVEHPRNVQIEGL